MHLHHIAAEDSGPSKPSLKVLHGHLLHPDPFNPNASHPGFSGKLTFIFAKAGDLG